MKGIRKIVSALPAVVAFIVTGNVEAAYNVEPIFTEFEARTNAIMFVSLILGDHALTLSDYNKYYSHHSEYETEEDLAYCHKSWGKPLSCDTNGKLVMEKNCKTYISSKHSSSQSPSLFLSRLRKLLVGSEPKFSIVSIEANRLGEVMSSYNIYGKIGDKNIELFHARTELALELNGLVNVLRIDGIELRDIVSQKYLDFERCE